MWRVMGVTLATREAAYGGRTLMTYAVAWQVLFNLAAQALQVAAEAGVGGETLGPLLRAVVAVRNSEQRVLEEIRRDVRALVEGPWHAGDLFLLEAEQVSERSMEVRLAAIELARQRFIDACGNLVHDHFSRALVEYRTAVCYLCLGSAQDARRWFERSHGSAKEALSELEQGTAWRREHQQLVDRARGVVRGGFARYVLPKWTPGVVAGLYDWVGTPERVVMSRALDGYEKLVLRPHKSREHQIVQAFLEGLQPLLA